MDTSTFGIFTARELRRYRSLFRSRDLIKTRDLIINNQSNNINNTNTNTVSVVAYVSRGSLSPNNRTVLRKEFVQRIPTSHVQLSLFPTSLSQYFASTSYLQKRRSLFKGSSFQRVITLNVPSDIKEPAQVASFIKVQRQLFFANLKKISSTESGSIAFNPLVVIFPTQVGSVAPRRFNQTKEYVNESLPQAVISKITYSQMRLYFIIKHRAKKQSNLIIELLNYSFYFLAR